MVRKGAFIYGNDVKDTNSVTSSLLWLHEYRMIKPNTFSSNSLTTGVFPSRMKIAKIKPIFKSGAKTDIGNYWPVSLLPQFKKMLEKLFLNTLDNFINAKDILNSSQYGFRKLCPHNMP